MEIETNRKANKVDQQYCDLLKDILTNGVAKTDRTGTGTRSVFGRQLRFDMSEGFPLLTSKKMYTKGIIVELLWFLGKHCDIEPYSKLGRTNIKYLVDNNCNIWVGDAYKRYVDLCSANESKWNYWMRQNIDRSFSMYGRDEFINMIKTDNLFAVKWGDLGPVYGEQWRSWYNPDMEPIDQIDNLVHNLKHSSDSRRLIVNAWNVADLDDMVLPPCHYGFQCYTRDATDAERVKFHSSYRNFELIGYGFYDGTPLTEDDRRFLDTEKVPRRILSLMWNQRSVDTPLGLPFNIASYGFLLHMLADNVSMIPGELICNLGDTHIYNNQFEGVLKQLDNPTYILPRLYIKRGKREDLSHYNIDDFIIDRYENAGTVEYPLSN